MALVKKFTKKINSGHGRSAEYLLQAGREATHSALSMFYTLCDKE
jgi:hypothetical protein